MASTGTLKEKNSPLIWSFFSFNVAIFYVVGFYNILELTQLNITSMITMRGIWILIVPLVLFVLNGVLSSDLKASIVFWRWKHPLPGCRAFTYYADKDDRIDKNALLRKYKVFPKAAKEQNSLWYKIYKIHQENPIVKKSHKDFLLARDISAISFLLLFVGGVSMFFIVKHEITWLYVGFLVAQLAIFTVIAQNHGKRFVCNALAMETSK